VEKTDLKPSKSATTWASWETAFQPNAGKHRSPSCQDWQKKTPLKSWDNSRNVPTEKPEGSENIGKL